MATYSETRISDIATLTLLAAILLVVHTPAILAHINPLTTLECHRRAYTYRADKRIILDGRYLPCYDDVTVYSCWGRCDSFEYGDYKIPFKISYHPVCTYGSRRSRQVVLRHCHPQHPNPVYEVFDALSCSCLACNSDDTSCENLNG